MHTVTTVMHGSLLSRVALLFGGVTRYDAPARHTSHCPAFLHRKANAARGTTGIQGYDGRGNVRFLTFANTHLLASSVGKADLSLAW
jgi:hypothetical protein